MNSTQKATVFNFDNSQENLSTVLFKITLEELRST